MDEYQAIGELLKLSLRVRDIQKECEVSLESLLGELGNLILLDKINVSDFMKQLKGR
jgi:hypothetical protein